MARRSDVRSNYSDLSFWAAIGRLVSISPVRLPTPAAVWLGYRVPELVLPRRPA